MLPQVGLAPEDVDFATFDHVHVQDVRMIMGSTDTIAGEPGPRAPLFPNARLLAHAVPGEPIYSATKHACLAFSVGTLLDLRRAGIDGVHVSALCPDGISAPMLYDKLDDPE